MNIGYIRVSTDKQDLSNQRHTLLEYANKNKIHIDDFVEIEISSKKDRSERRIDELVEKLNSGDTIFVTELSRLGRTMLEVMNIIDELEKKKVNIVFINQPELSSTGSHRKLLQAIYSYIAQTEREFISMRTRLSLQALKAKGVTLGRPVGSLGKSKLDGREEEIKKYLAMKIPLMSIMKLLKGDGLTVSYKTLYSFIKTRKLG